MTNTNIYSIIGLSLPERMTHVKHMVETKINNDKTKAELVQEFNGLSDNQMQQVLILMRQQLLGKEL